MARGLFLRYMKAAILAVSEHGVFLLEVFTFVVGMTGVDMPFHIMLFVLHVHI